MTKSIDLQGMSCNMCAQKLEQHFNAHPFITNSKVSRKENAAHLQTSKALSEEELNLWVKKLDAKYSVINTETTSAQPTESRIALYKPLLLIFFFILLITLSIEYTLGDFELQRWMRHFMAGFFICFSFFKFLDLEGFANSYTGYDIIAKNWKPWAYIYPFVELSLGLSYLLHCCPFATNLTAFIVMSVSLIGVVQSVLNKQKIRCACLGAVFNLPMSTVTISEDLLMILMSGYMILQLV